MGLFKDIPYSLEESMREKGTLYKQAALPFTSCVILSGRLITGQNPASARGVALKVIEQCQAVEGRDYHYKMEA